MNLYEEGLSHLFGLNPRKKTLRGVITLTLVTASVVTPITFRHAIWDYSERRIAMVMKWVIDPTMKQLNDNFAKQMQKAQQQRVQSSHK